MSLSTVSIVGLVLVAVFWAWFAFNRLVNARNLVRAAWSDIDVQLQRRHDLIPRLVEAVKAYSAFERATLDAVTGLRERSLKTSRLAERAAVEAELESATHRLIALAESYPDLKASRNFLELQTELATTEDHLQYARRFYNGSVRDYNTRLQSFPDSLIAGPLRFDAADFFSADEAAAARIRVDLGS